MKVLAPILMTRTVLPAVFLLALSATGKENWPQFRGPDALGVSENPDLPDKWSPTENVLWKRDPAIGQFISFIKIHPSPFHVPHFHLPG